MTIINQIKNFLLIIICFGCSVQKKEIETSCLKVNIESETEYKGNNNFISNQMIDFNNASGKSIDIVRILSTSGYDYTEDFKRLYIDGGKVFVVENENIKELSLNSKKIQSQFEQCDNLKSLVNCKTKSSQNSHYRFFVKKDGKLVMTFTSNEVLENIDKDLIKDELVFFSIFENTN